VTEDYGDPLNFYKIESEVFENYVNTIKNNFKHLYENSKIENTNTRINRGIRGKKKYNAFGNFSKKEVNEDSQKMI
jgi:hypothetical protein